MSRPARIRRIMAAIGAQRQTPGRGQAGDEKLDPAAEAGLLDPGRITVSKAEEFAIAKRGGFTSQVQNLFPPGSRKFLNRQRRCQQLINERNILAPDQ